jgi:mono/diheme cytochrome c family protein
MRDFMRFFLTALGFSAALGLYPGCKRKEVEGDTQAEAKHLFDSVCAKCHGADGRGGVPAMEGQPAPRNFRDAAFQASRTDEQLKQAIREGKGPMPPFAALFDATQTANLVLYIRSFGPKKDP